MMWHTDERVFMVLFMNSSAKNFTLIKFLQDWFPDSSAECNKCDHLTICNCFSHRCNEESDTLLSCLSDKMYTHNYELEDKFQSMRLKCVMSLTISPLGKRKRNETQNEKKLKFQQRTGKVMVTVYWDSLWPVLMLHCDKKQCMLQEMCDKLK